MANELRYRASIKDDVSGPLERLKDRIGAIRQQGARPLLEGLAVGAGIAAFNMLGSAIGGATDYLVNSVKAAAEEEVGIARLNASLEANVKGWESQADAIEAGIKSRVRLGFADDQVRESLAKLVPVTHDVTRAYEIMNTAQDLARFKGVALTDATAALVKVMTGGGTRELKALGIVLKDNATATEALAEVQRVAAGQAAAYMDTLAGKTEELNNRLADLQEEIGARVTPGLNNMAGAVLDVIAVTEGAQVPVQNLTRDIASLAGVFKTLPLIGFTAQVYDGAASVQELAAKAGDIVTKGAKARATLLGFGQAADDAAGLTDGLSDEARRAAARFGSVAAQAKRAADRLGDLEGSVDDARDALADAATEPANLKDELELTKLQGKDLKDELEKLKDKKPTRGVREDILETRIAIRENKATVADLEGQLVMLGKVSLSDHKKTIEKLGDKWANAEAEVRDYITALRQIPGVKVPATGTGNPGQLPRAGGGPVLAGQSYLVGENGPEMLTLGGSQNGNVRPTVSGMGASFGPSLVLNISTPVLTPGAAQAVADAIAPAITRWQQQRGL